MRFVCLQVLDEQDSSSVGSKKVITVDVVMLYLVDVVGSVYSPPYNFSVILPFVELYETGSSVNPENPALVKLLFKAVTILVVV